MTRFWWVRHGPTHRRDLIGWTDAPADLSNEDQIARLNAFLPQDATVISSDLLRAVATADAVSEGRQRLPNDTGLREIHFGEWEARTYDDVSASNPDHSRAYWEQPGDIRPPGGESWNDLRQRVDDAVSRLATINGDVIVVAHFGTILTRLQQARGCSSYDILAQKISNLSVTRIDFSDGAWREVLSNHTP